MWTRVKGIQFETQKNSKKTSKHASKEKIKKKIDLCRISPKNKSLNLRIPWSLPCYPQGENQQIVVGFCDFVLVKWENFLYIERFCREIVMQSREMRFFFSILTLFLKRDGGESYQITPSLSVRSYSIN